MKYKLSIMVLILVLALTDATEKLERIKKLPQEKQKHIADLIAKIAKEKHEQNEQSMRAEQRTLQFHQRLPQKKLDIAAFKRIFPQLFAGVPERYHQGIIDYAQNQYGDALLKELEAINKKGTKSVREFKWTALGTIFKRAPFSGAGYLFISDPKNRKNIEAHFTHLPTFILAKNDYKEMQLRLAQVKNDQVKNNLLRNLPIEQENVKKIANTLVGNYKIHMMPKGSLTEILVKLLEAIDKDPELNRLIGDFKLALGTNYEKDGTVFPLIAFYSAPGKENAQKLLNKLYYLFKDTPGLNKRPRYNARVTDLLWIAQGDGDYKTDEFAKYYEPNRVYYRADITGILRNYHLVHPETGKEIA